MKILYLDIETMYAEAQVWGLWKQNIPISMVTKPTRMFCYSALWDHEEDEDPFFLHEEQSYWLTRLWQLLDEADVVIHYNGKNFDIPFINRHFMLADMPPPSNYIQVDLLKEIKRCSRFDSHKLDWISQQFDIGSKLAHEGIALWQAWERGDVDARKRMEKYNKQDVVLLKQLFNKIKPWLTSNPNPALFTADDGQTCPGCGGNVYKKGFYYTKISKFQRYKCKDCGANSRGRKNLADRTNLLVKI